MSVIKLYVDGMILDNYITLGKTEIKISAIGLGVMQWGAFKINLPYSSANNDLLEIYQTTLNKGINFFDTAEMYGNGKSEIHLGICLKEAPAEVVVATKFMPYPWRLTKDELKSALVRSLKRLGLSRVDLYQMHWPYPPVSIKTWMDAMADAAADGLIRAVGVSNYSPNQTRMAYEALAKHNIPLASNQIRYSLLDRRPERSGLVDLCRGLGITIIAYSPLEKGILTGKYHADHLPTGYRAYRYNKKYLEKIIPLLDALRSIGQTHNDATASQVALNWLTCKGAVPIPGARNKQQAEENSGGLGWQLSVEEVTRLDDISATVLEK